MEQAEALTTLGSEITFSVAFAIARELRDEAIASNISDVELIAIMTLLTIALNRVPSVTEEVWTRALELFSRFLKYQPWLEKVMSNANSHEHGSTKRSDAAHAKYGTTKTIGSFFRLFLDIAKRISANLLVQLVANAIVARETQRSARIVSLLTITIFFVFLQSGAMFTVAGENRY